MWLKFKYGTGTVSGDQLLRTDEKVDRKTREKQWKAWMKGMRDDNGVCWGHSQHFIFELGGSKLESVRTMSAVGCCWSLSRPSTSWTPWHAHFVCLCVCCRRCVYPSPYFIKKNPTGKNVQITKTLSTHEICWNGIIRFLKSFGFIWFLKWVWASVFISLKKTVKFRALFSNF